MGDTRECRSCKQGLLDPPKPVKLGETPWADPKSLAARRMMFAVAPHCQHPQCPWCAGCVARQNRLYSAARKASQ